MINKIARDFVKLPFLSHRDDGYIKAELTVTSLKVLLMVSIDDDLTVHELGDREPWFVCHICGPYNGYVGYNPIQFKYVWFNAKYGDLPPKGSWPLFAGVWIVVNKDAWQPVFAFNTVDQWLIQYAIENYLHGQTKTQNPI